MMNEFRIYIIIPRTDPKKGKEEGGSKERRGRQ